MDIFNSVARNRLSSTIDEARCCGIVGPMNKVVRTIKIASKLDAAVERLAKEKRRTPSDIVSDAIKHLLAHDEDVTIELERLAEYERTGEAIDLEDARDRLKAQVREHQSKTVRPKKQKKK